MTQPAPRAGLLLLDKPAGMTSHDAVVWLRHRLSHKKVGHAGTLDPLATGLLPLFVGHTTRLTDLLHAWPKTYTGLIVLGRETPTGDREGIEGERIPLCPLPPTQVIEEARRRLTGEIWQQPPSFSARKIGGMPAYKIARQGFEPVLAPSKVMVFKLRLVPERGGRIRFAARVGSGTYIRSLARDLGRILGTGAYLGALRRTGIGPLRVREAWSPSGGDREVWESRLLAPQDIPLPCPEIQLGSEDLAAFRHGRSLSGFCVEGEVVRILTPAGGLAGIGECSAEGTLHPRIVFPAGLETGGVAPQIDRC